MGRQTFFTNSSPIEKSQLPFTPLASLRRDNIFCQKLEQEMLFYKLFLAPTHTPVVRVRA